MAAYDIFYDTRQKYIHIAEKISLETNIIFFYVLGN